MEDCSRVDCQQRWKHDRQQTVMWYDIMVKAALMPVCFVVCCCFFIVCFLLCCSFWTNKVLYLQGWPHHHILLSLESLSRLPYKTSDQRSWHLSLSEQYKPGTLYGTEAYPITSADKHSLEFTINKVLYKIFGAMSKDSYGEICKHFGIDKVEESISHRQERFVKL